MHCETTMQMAETKDCCGRGIGHVTRLTPEQAQNLTADP